MTHRSRLWKRSTFISLTLVAAVLIAACAPAVSTPFTASELDAACSATVETGPILRVSPGDVTGGTLVAVSGADWQPGEEVYINLETADLPELNGTFAVARARADGRLNISFYFPTDERWRQVKALLLVARNSGANHEVVVPLAMQALDAPEAPVAVPAAPDETAVPVRVAGQATVTSQFANLRLGPSTDYPVVDVVEVGTVLNVSGQNDQGDWRRVQSAVEGDGWISRQLTDFTNTVRVLAAPPLARLNTEPVITGWRGEYFTNPTLEGTPSLVRNDPNVRFNWGYSAPTANFPTDGFSARWTRSLPFAAGTYDFYAHVDDGVRVWLDDNLIIDAWREQSPETHTGEQVLTEGEHQVRIEYLEVAEQAEIDFYWERSADFENWQGEYFPNRRLSGSPVTVRDDAAIDFDWGAGAPAPDLPENDFSVRWTRSLEFAPGLYSFHARMDDGFRLFINGTLVIDQWLDGGVREVVADVRVAEGTYALRAEHYDRSGDAVAQLWWEQIEPSTPFVGWKGEYWANDSLTGEPVLVRDDAVINFDWKTSTPDFGIPVEQFSARWSRPVQFDTDTYRFFVNADDGVRLWVNDSLLVDEWTDGPSETVVDYPMASGTYDVRVEYRELSGDARVQVRWEKLQPPTNFPDWQGEYYPNQDLQGAPVLVRNDAEVNFNWHEQAPGPALPRDRFSARWTRPVFFENGRYRFYARADDGLRISVDGNTVLDRWHGSDGTEVYLVDVDLGGVHRIAVEYYEDLGGVEVAFWWHRVE